jgi:two-component system OmpR family sensor kinase
MDDRHGTRQRLPAPGSPGRLSFRTRLIVAVAAVTAATLGGAFAVVSFVVNQDQERHLDSELLDEALHEASETARLVDGKWVISDRPGPAMHQVAPLPKVAAIYDARGALLTANVTMKVAPPAFAQIRHAPRHCFDLTLGEHVLRAVIVPFAREPGARLFLAVPRTDLDGDAAFLANAMEIVWVVACLWAILVAITVVRRLTSNHQAIITVAHQVADGNLDARIGRRAGDRETAQLAEDIDHMIERLSTLVTSQQRFIAYAAHELRSPLTTLYGELSHALRRPRDADEYRRAIEEALDSTYRLKVLAEDLLALARLGAPPDPAPESTPLARIVDAAVHAALKLASQSQVGVEVQGSAGDLRVLGRAQDLERLLRNLLDNAIQHSPEGATVRVEVDAREAELLVAVVDEGPGVAAEDAEKIFEPFFRRPRTAPERSPGAGLGLAIAGEIAQAHGGSIRVEQAAGQPRGARFVVTLPAARAAQARLV